MTWSRIQFLAGLVVVVLSVSQVALATNGGVCNTRITYDSNTIPPYVHAPTMACEKNDCPNPCTELHAGNRHTCACDMGGGLEGQGACHLEYEYEIGPSGGGGIVFDCINEEDCEELECGGDHTGSVQNEDPPAGPGGWTWVYGCNCQ